MATPDILDFEALLVPISDNAPAGVDPRFDASPSSPYYAVKDARNSARAKERQLAMGAEDLKMADIIADWRRVTSMGPKLLSTQAKDLEVVAYMIEALCRLNGFAGLRDGFRLTRELVERFWDGIFPTPDEDGVVTRVAAITGLNGDDAEGTLIMPIVSIPITEDGDKGPLSKWHYDQAGAISRIEDLEVRQQRIDKGAVSLEVFDQTAARTAPQFFMDLYDDIQQASDEFQALCSLFDDKCGSMAPPSSNIRTAIGDVKSTIESIARGVLGGAVSEGETGAAAASGGSTSAGGGGGGLSLGGLSAGNVNAREEAFAALVKIADFFRKTEPQSPVTTLVEQAVRWGRMPLQELLVELVDDEGARNGMYRLLGIKRSE